jgi:hypothetical protein
MSVLVDIVLIVVGILQIILFFKIWGATDNIKKLLSEYEFNSQLGVKEFLSFSKSDFACEKLNARLYKEFVDWVSTKPTNEYTRNDFKRVQNSIIKEYLPKYAKIGKEIPQKFTDADFDDFK